MGAKGLVVEEQTVGSVSTWAGARVKGDLRHFWMGQQPCHLYPHPHYFTIKIKGILLC